jgi:site-specific recombinase XerD
MDSAIEQKYLQNATGKNDLALSTAKLYLGQVRQFLKKMDLAPDQVSQESCVEWLSRLKLEYRKNPNTRRNVKLALKNFFKWYAPLVGMQNPALNLGTIKEYRTDAKIIHPEEIENMLNEVNKLNNDWSKRGCALIAFLAMTGCRVGEVERLKFGDITLSYNRKTDQSYFQAFVTAQKGTFNRTIPFGELVIGNIVEYFARYYIWCRVELDQKPGNPLFFQLYNNNGAKEELNLKIPLKRDGIRYTLAKAQELSGIKRKLNAHAFRHFYGTYSVINSQDLISLAYLMGHSNLETTRRYVSIASRLTGQALKHGPDSDIKTNRMMHGFNDLLKSVAKKKALS